MTVLGEEVVLDVGFFRCVITEFTNTKFDGTESERKKHFVLNRGDSVGALIHLVASNEIILVEQVRIATVEETDGWLLEIPAGRIDEHESSLQAVEREVMEEVGVLTTHTERIGSVFPSPGACNEYIHLFYCPIQGNVHVASTAGLESENEDIKTHRISSSEFVRMAMHHEILDAKTLLCAYWFKDRFEL